MISYCTYCNYKDSGAPWLGAVPAHWRLERAKWHFSVRNERGNSEPLLLAATQKNGMYPQEKVDGVVKVADGTDIQQFKTVHKSDFVISLRSFQGGFERSDYEGVCSPAYQVFFADQTIWNNDYLKFLFKDVHFIDAMNALTVGIREGRNIKYEDFANSLIAIPPRTEQTAIAEYLLARAQEIDEIISEAKASIEEYKTWKASIIYEAVTKGLDPNVEMKESGIKWIGTVPQHWSVSRLKTVVTSVESGVSVNASQTAAGEDKIGVLKTSSVSKYYFNPKENKEVNSDELNRVSCQVKANTIIVSRMNTPELVGACGYVEKDYPLLYLPDRLWQVHFNESVKVKYIYYYLCSNYIKNYYASLSSGTSSSMQNISQGQFLNAVLLLPGQGEQNEIATFLDNKCSDIEAIIQEKENLITDLESYKKALIFEVVTGKRRVC